MATINRPDEYYTAGVMYSRLESVLERYRMDTEAGRRLLCIEAAKTVLVALWQNEQLSAKDREKLEFELDRCPQTTR